MVFYCLSCYFKRGSLCIIIPYFSLSWCFTAYHTTLKRGALCIIMLYFSLSWCFTAYHATLMRGALCIIILYFSLSWCFTAYRTTLKRGDLSVIILSSSGSPVWLYYLIPFCSIGSYDIARQLLESLISKAVDLVSQSVPCSTQYTALH